MKQRRLNEFSMNWHSPSLALCVVTLLFFCCPRLAWARPRLFHEDTKISAVMINVNSHSQQGDALLLSEPQGKNILVDTGHQSEAEELLTFLRAYQVTHLNQVLVTHPHNDHYGGLKHLPESSDIAIDEILLGPVTKKRCTYEYWGCFWTELKQLRKLAARKNIPISDYSSWQGFAFNNGAVFTKLFQFTEKTTPLPSTDINDLSLIARLVVGKHSMLFTGDLNSSLSRWITEHAAALLQSTVLKVPHHGTESTAVDDFFRLTRAKYFLVPSPAALWCSARSSRIRALTSSLGEVFVNGLAGHVFVRFGTRGVDIERSRDGQSGCPA